MSVVTKAALKAYFETGDFPTSVQFAELIDNISEWAEVSLTAAQIKTGNSVPIDAIAAPGVGKAIEVLSSSISYTYNAVNFDNNAIDLITDTAAYIQARAANVFSAAASNFVRCDVVQSTGGTQLIENKKLRIRAAADSAATGLGTVKVYILYRIITL